MEKLTDGRDGPLKFNLKQLEVFVAVAEKNSFTGAAGALYLTQSTISAHINSLETALGVRLLSRDAKRNVQLTSEGQALYPAAKQILKGCRELHGVVQGAAAEGPLLLGASTVPAQYLLPEILASFLKQRPDSQYLLKRGDSAQIHELLRAEIIRIGFVGAAQPAADLRYCPIAEDRLVMVTENSPKYRKLRQCGVKGCDLLGEPTVAREVGSGTDRTVNAYMQKLQIPASVLHIVARIDDPEAIKSLVVRGAGVSVLSALAVREEVAAGKLLSFEIDSQGLTRPIYMVTRKQENHTELEQQFLRFAENAANGQFIID